MKRDYITGESDDAVYFVGVEVERTPAYGLPTLFVTGVQPIETIEKHLEELGIVEHIFFGANHSFNPVLQDYDSWKEWEDMIYPFLRKDIWCSLDIDIKYAEEFNESGFCEYDTFIPQLRVPVPYVTLWNYNTMIKIDDKDFKATNPGVWCHSLHDLMDRKKFTDWKAYGLDKVLK